MALRRSVFGLDGDTDFLEKPIGQDAARTNDDGIHYSRLDRTPASGGIFGAAGFYRDNSPRAAYARIFLNRGR